MQLTWKVLFAGFAGGIAAVVTWLLVDASGFLAEAFSDHGTLPLAAHAVEYAVYQGIFAILLAGMLAVSDGVFRDLRDQRRYGLVVGIGCGLIGGMLGPSLGSGLCVLFPAPAYTRDGSSSTGYLLNLFFMSLGWAVTGGTAGAVAGLARGSRKIALIGAAAGTFGALGGGFLFQLVAAINTDDATIGQPWRLAALCLTAVLAAVFATLMADFDRPVWVHRVTTRGHAREYAVSRSPFKIGSDPSSDINIPANTNVAPTHAIIERIPDMGRHRLRHAARAVPGRQRYVPTIINDESITSEKWLMDGDTITIAGVEFVFHEAATRVLPRNEAELYYPLREEIPAPQEAGAADKSYIEDRMWEMTAGKTASINSAILPVTEEAEPLLLDDVPVTTSTLQTVAEEPAPQAQRLRRIRAPHRLELDEEAPNPLPTSRLPPAVNITQIDPDPPAIEAPLPPVTDPLPSIPIPPPAIEDRRAPGGRKSIGTRLACVGGPYLGQSFALSHQSSLIGRSLDHAIALPADTKVSRTHARIVYENGVHIISDFGSANGVLVNDDFVTIPRTLHIGDVITAGGSRLRYE